MKTCNDCSLLGRKMNDGHCYMWKNWPDNEICGHFLKKFKRSKKGQGK